MLPITRLLEVEDYLDYISNRIIPGFGEEVLKALEGLWSRVSGMARRAAHAVEDGTLGYVLLIAAKP